MARPKTAVLTREKVVGAAVDLIGDGGLEAFSMPKLASALGVRAPSLYHHFSDKDELLAEVARAVATPDPAPSAAPAGGAWTDFLVAQAVAMRSTIVRHPHCAPLLVRFMPRRDMFGEYEQICRYLADSGVPARFHIRIVDGVTALTIGAALLRENGAHYTASGAGPSPLPGSHPALEAALAAVEGCSPDELFERYIRTYLDSIEREMAGEDRRRARR